MKHLKLVKISSLFSPVEKRLLAALAWANFAHIVDFMIMMPLGPQLMRVLAINPEQFSFLVSSYTLSAGLCAVLASSFVDRFDRKKTLMFLYLGFCVGTVACSMAPNFIILLLFRILTGAFGGLASSTVLAIVGDSFPTERRGTAMGIVMTGFSAAAVIGVPIGLFLAAHLDWHAPFLYLGLVSFIMGFFIWFSVPSIRDHLMRGKSENLFQLLGHPSHWISLGFMFLLIMGHFLVIPFVSPSLVKNAGLTEHELTFFYLIGGVGTFISAPWVGRLSDRFGKPVVFKWGILISVFPILGITMLGKTPLLLVLPLAGFLFIAINSRMIPAMAMITGTVKTEIRGGFMSLISACQQLAMATAALTSGQIIAEGLNGELLYYPWVGILAVMFSLLSLWASRWLRPIGGSF